MIVHIEEVMKGREMKAALREADQAGADKALSSYSDSVIIVLTKDQAVPNLESIEYMIPNISHTLSLDAQTRH